MSVKSHELDNQERGMDIETRQKGRPTQDDELKILRGRIGAAMTIEPPAKHCDAHVRFNPCPNCWRRGRDAAIRAIEGNDG